MIPLKTVIEKELERKNLTKKELIDSIGMTETGFYKMIQRNDIKLSTLEEIGKVLNIPIESFFVELEKKTVEPDKSLMIWEEKEKNYKNTIENLLQTIRSLSLGKRRGTSYALSA